MTNLFIFSVFLILSCNKNSKDNTKVAENFAKIESLADAYVEAAIDYFPENYAFYNLDEVDHGGLSNNSPEAIEKWRQLIDSLAGKFEEINPNHEVGSESWYLYGYLKEALESEKQIRVCKFEYATINHLSGWHIQFQRIASVQPAGNKKAQNDAIRRWNQLPVYVDNQIQMLRLGIAEGYTVPKDVVEIVMGQIKEILSTPVTRSEYYSPAKRDTSLAFKNQWKEVVMNSVYPSLKKYHDFLKNEYYPSAREGISLADLPNGKEAFEAYYRYSTSVKRDVEEILDVSSYRLRLNNSKLRLYGQEKYGKDSIPILLKDIFSDTINYFNSAEEMLRFAKETVKKAKEQCGLAFSQIPEQEVEVLAISEKMQATMASHYIHSMDSTGKPSKYYINLGDYEMKMRSDLESEIFHETFPGHHLQIGLAGERNTMHLLTKLFTSGGYTEGWASYAQVLADEMGLYEGGYSRFFILGRSSRIMYLEAMIHSGKWDREQAINYLMEYGSSTREKAQSVVNRLIVWPGQFSTYDTGLLEILELREKAMLTLGDDFDIKEFHNVVLKGGAIPLQMLREKVNWWLEKKMENKGR